MYTFISDLDSTLVYLHTDSVKDVIPVEKIDENKFTYMTRKAKQMMDELLKSEGFNFIPCSIRSKELVQRISFIKEYHPKYMICDNGATLYVDEKKDENYEKYLIESNIVNFDDVKKFRKILEKIVPDETRFYDHEEYFLEIVFNSIDTANRYLPLLINKINDKNYIYKLDKRKFYIIHKRLGKEVAVRYLKNNYNLGYLITSGDTFVDEEFVKLGDTILIPNHANFSIENEIRTKENGILACEEIIERIHHVKL